MYLLAIWMTSLGKYLSTCYLDPFFIGLFFFCCWVVWVPYIFFCNTPLSDGCFVDIYGQALCEGLKGEGSSKRLSKNWFITKSYFKMLSYLILGNRIAAKKCKWFNFCTLWSFCSNVWVLNLWTMNRTLVGLRTSWKVNSQLGEYEQMCIILGFENMSFSPNSQMCLWPCSLYLLIKEAVSLIGRVDKHRSFFCTYSNLKHWVWQHR